MNTRTGFAAVGDGDGVHTLTVKQSSLNGPCWSRPPALCAHAGPSAAASSGVGHAAAWVGARQRSAPTGGAAYGMPRNEVIVPSAWPITMPRSVATWLVASSSLVASGAGVEPGDAQPGAARAAATHASSGLLNMSRT